MKEIIEELRKPPKPSGKTYIKGIIKEQKEYKKLDKSHKTKKKVKNMGKKKKKSRLDMVLKNVRPKDRVIIRAEISKIKRKYRKK